MKGREGWGWNRPPARPLAIVCTAGSSKTLLPQPVKFPGWG